MITGVPPDVIREILLDVDPRSARNLNCLHDFGIDSAVPVLSQERYLIAIQTSLINKIARKLYYRRPQTYPTLKSAEVAVAGYYFSVPGYRDNEDLRLLFGEINWSDVQQIWEEREIQVYLDMELDDANKNYIIQLLKKFNPIVYDHGVDFTTGEDPAELVAREIIQLPYEEAIRRLDDLCRNG